MNASVLHCLRVLEDLAILMSSNNSWLFTFGMSRTSGVLHLLFVSGDLNPLSTHLKEVGVEVKHKYRSRMPPSSICTNEDLELTTGSERAFSFTLVA